MSGDPFPTSDNKGFQGQQEPTEQEKNLPTDVEAGVTGLYQSSGYLNEEKMQKLLPTQKAMAIFREMRDNDAVVNAIMFAVEMMMRQIKGRVEPFSSKEKDILNAEFLETCQNDMSHTWENFASERATKLTFGFALHEIVYKRRIGPDQKDPSKRSKYTDGLIGWRKIPIRAQESIQNWVFDEDGGIQGAWQWPPNSGQKIYLPIEKCLLFRTTSNKNNPEGRSVLRGAYTSYYRKTNLERLESIGIERDLCGMPVMYVPAALLAKDADAKTKSNLQSYEALVKRLRLDEQMGVVLPSLFDANNNQLVKLELLSSTGSRRQVGTDKAIERYAQSIAMTVLADFVLLGHEQVGSLALASKKTELFNIALGAFTDDDYAVLNRYAVPRLFQLNGETDMEELPRFMPGELEKQDIAELSAAVAQIVQAGMLQPAGLDDENFWRKLLGMPERTEVPTADPDENPEENYLSVPQANPNVPAEGQTFDAKGNVIPLAAAPAGVPGSHAPNPVEKRFQQIMKGLKAARKRIGVR